MKRTLALLVSLCMLLSSVSFAMGEEYIPEENPEIVIETEESEIETEIPAEEAEILSIEEEETPSEEEEEIASEEEGEEEIPSEEEEEIASEEEGEEEIPSEEEEGLVAKMFPWALTIEPMEEATFEMSDDDAWTVMVAVSDGGERSDSRNYNVFWEAEVLDAETGEPSAYIGCTATESEEEPAAGCTVKFSWLAQKKASSPYEGVCHVTLTMIPKDNLNERYTAECEFDVHILPDLALFYEDEYFVDATAANGVVEITAVNTEDMENVRWTWPDFNWETDESYILADYVDVEIVSQTDSYCKLLFSFTEMKSVDVTLLYTADNLKTAMEAHFTVTPVIRPQIEMDTTLKINAAHTKTGTISAEVTGVPAVEDIESWKFTLTSQTANGIATVAQVDEGEDATYTEATFQATVKDGWENLTNPAEYTLKYEYTITGEETVYSCEKTFYVYAVESADIPEDIVPHDSVLRGTVGETAVVYLPSFTEESIPLTWQSINYSFSVEDRVNPENAQTGWKLKEFHYDENDVVDGYIINLKKAGRYVLDLRVDYKDEIYTASVLLLIADKNGVVPDGLSIEGDTSPVMYDSGTDTYQSEYILEGYDGVYDGEACEWSILNKSEQSVRVSIYSRENESCVLQYRRGSSIGNTTFTLRCTVGEGDTQVVKDIAITALCEKDSSLLPSAITLDQESYTAAVDEDVTINYAYTGGVLDEIKSYSISLSADGDESYFVLDEKNKNFTGSFESAGRYSGVLTFTAGNFTLTKEFAIIIQDANGKVPSQGITISGDSTFTLTNVNQGYVNCFDLCEYTASTSAGKKGNGTWQIKKKSGNATNFVLQSETGSAVSVLFSGSAIGTDKYTISYTLLGETVSREVSVTVKQVSNLPTGIRLTKTEYTGAKGNVIAITYPTVSGGSAETNSLMTFEIEGVDGVVTETTTGWNCKFTEEGTYIVKVIGHLGFKKYETPTVKVYVTSNGTKTLYPVLHTDAIDRICLASDAPEECEAATFTLANADLLDDVTWNVDYPENDSLSLTLVPEDGGAVLTARLKDGATEGKITYTVTCSASNADRAQTYSGTISLVSISESMPTGINVSNTASCKAGEIFSTTVNMIGGSDSVCDTYTFTAQSDAEGFNMWTGENDTMYFLFSESSGSAKFKVSITAKSAKYPNYVFTRVLSFTVNEPDNPTLLMPDTIEVAEGGVMDIPYTYTNRPVSDTLTFTTSSPSIAKVVNSTQIKGIKTGECTLTVKSAKTGISYTSKVRVVVKPTSIKLSATEMNLSVKDKSKSITATVLPTKAASYYSASYSSSDETVCKVSATGRLTPVSVGDAVITAESEGVIATCTVHVIKMVESISLTEGSQITVLAGQTETLQVAIQPEDATIRDYTIKSSASGILKVLEDGSLYGVKASDKAVTLTITTTDGSNKTIQCKAYVTTPTESISILYNKKAQTTIAMPAGSKTKLALSASVKPDKASKSVLWSVDDTDIATVNNGIVTFGSKVGQTTLHVTALDGTGTEGTVELIAYQTAEVLTIEGPGEIAKGKSATFTVTADTDMQYEEVTWKSSNAKIVKVTDAKKGIVKGLKAGTATLTAVATGGATKSIQVTVRPAAKKMTATPEEIVFNLTDATEKTAQISVSITPAEASTNVEYNSDNEGVAWVDETGMVTWGGEEGTATITVMTTDGSKVKAKIPVKAFYGARSVTILNDEMEIAKGDKVQLYAEVDTDGSDTSVTWTSSNPKIAKIISGDTVKGVKASAESVTITATTSDGMCSDEITLRVVDKAKSITLNKKTLLFLSDDPEAETTAEIIATVNPATASQKVTFSSNNEGLVTVDETGHVTYLGGTGTATIFCTTENGITASVSVAARSINDCLLVTGKDAISINEFVTLSTTVGGKSVPVELETSNKSIAKITADNRVKGLKVGTVTITATTADGLTAEFDIKVCAASKSVSLNKTGIFFDTDKSGQAQSERLIATVKPNSAMQNVDFTSSDESIATVDENGLVTWQGGSGSCTITATTQDGQKLQATATVIACSASEGLRVAGEDGVAVKGKITLNATLNGSAASVKWTTSDKKIATVSDKGVVKGVKAGGPVQITATTTDGTFTATHSVMVYDAAKSVSLNSSDIAFDLDTEGEKKFQLSAVVYPIKALQKVTYSTDRNDLLQVDETGLVTWLGEAGSAKVYARTADGTDVTAVATVRAFHAVTFIEIHGNTYLAQGSKTTFTAVVNENATDKTVTWTSSNPKIAKVVDAQNGIVKGIAASTEPVTITAKSNDGQVTASVQLTVTAPAKSVTLAETDVTFQLDDPAGARSVQLHATVQPDSALQNVTYTSSDANVAQVNETGLVTWGGKSGKAVITCEAADGSGKKATMNVTAFYPVTELTITGSEQIAVKYKTTLTAVANENATDSSVKWKSSDTSVATVDATGTVTGVKIGAVIITATSVSDSSIFASFAMQVVSAPKDIEVYTTLIEFPMDDPNGLREKQISAGITPSDAPQDMVYTSSDPAVAQVSDSGLVTWGGTKGTCEITVSSKVAPSLQKTVKVCAMDTISTFEIVGYKDLMLGNTIQLKAVANGDTVITDVVWSVSPADKAKISQNGVVTGKEAGDVVVTCTLSFDESVSATHSVKVRTLAIATIELQNALGEAIESLTLSSGSSEKITAVLKMSKDVVSERGVVFSSSNENVFTVSEDGTVTAVGSGSANLTVVVADGTDMQKTIPVTVR